MGLRDGGRAGAGDALSVNRRTKASGSHRHQKQSAIILVTADGHEVNERTLLLGSPVLEANPVVTGSGPTLSGGVEAGGQLEPDDGPAPPPCPDRVGWWGAATRVAEGWAGCNPIVHHRRRGIEAADIQGASFSGFCSSGSVGYRVGRFGCRRCGICYLGKDSSLHIYGQERERMCQYVRTTPEVPQAGGRAQKAEPAAGGRASPGCVGPHILGARCPPHPIIALSLPSPTCGRVPWAVSSHLPQGRQVQQSAAGVWRWAEPNVGSVSLSSFFLSRPSRRTTLAASSVAAS